MKTITIEGQLRSEVGKKATRKLRSEGNTPGVIYGGPKEVNFYAPEIAFRDLVYTPKFQLAELKLGDKVYQCVLKDLQFDPVTDQLLHVDFVELVEDKKVVVSIPLSFEGQSKAEKDGGRVVTKLKSVKVKSYPKDLKENIIVDITKLKIGESIRVRDIEEEAFDILNAERIPIVTGTTTRKVVLTTATVEDEEVAEEGAEAAAETEEKAEE